MWNAFGGEEGAAVDILSVPPCGHPEERIARAVFLRLEQRRRQHSQGKQSGDYHGAPRQGHPGGILWITVEAQPDVGPGQCESVGDEYASKLGVEIAPRRRAGLSRANTYRQ